MSETITATDANRRFAELLREVGGGKSFTVTSHGRPVATIAPVRDDAADREAAKRRLLARLAAQPPSQTGAWTRADLYEDE
jgi:prevent-host-death family protein